MVYAFTRCSYKNLPEYPHYGGRGIKVCERWHEFEDFLADMGEKPSQKYSIDRLDVNGNYEKDNCRWATRIQQARNTTKTKFHTANGETLCLSEWAERLGITSSAMAFRFKKYSPEEAVSRPVNKTMQAVKIQQSLVKRFDQLDKNKKEET